MQRTGEREVPSLPGTVEGIDPKHLARYRWAQPLTCNRLVYEVGSGAGYGVLLLDTREYVGFDNSAEAVKYANTYYGNGRTVRFSVADACHMPEMDRADVIVSFDTIEHLEDPEAMLQWCAGHGDVLLISSPIRYSFGRSHFHRFEYRLSQFVEALDRRFDEVQVLIQQQDSSIGPNQSPDDKGVAVAICRRPRE